MLRQRLLRQFTAIGTGLLFLLTPTAAMANPAAPPAPAAPADGRGVTPRQPLVIDGVRYQPAAAKRLAPSVRYTIVAADGTTVGYRDKARYERDLRKRKAALRQTATARAATGPARFWEYSHFQGASFSRHWYSSDANLGSIDCFIWCHYWNDRISSMVTGENWVTVYEHINFTGRATTFAPPFGGYELPWEWNNQISSVVTY